MYLAIKFLPIRVIFALNKLTPSFLFSSTKIAKKHFQKLAINFYLCYNETCTEKPTFRNSEMLVKYKDDDRK